MVFYTAIIKYTKKYYISFIFLLVSLFLTYNYTDFSSNMSIGVGHVYTAKSLALSRNFNVDEYWGNAGVDVFKHNDHYYAAYAPLNAVLMAIPYFILQVFYYFYTNSIASINGDLSLIFESIAFGLPSSISIFILSIFIQKHLIKIAVRKNIINLSIFSFLFATIILNYSVSFFNHAHTALFIFLAFYIIESNVHSAKKYFFTGMFVGLAFLNEHPSILFSIPILIREVYLLSRNKHMSKFKYVKSSIINLSIFSIPVLFSIFLILIYNYIHFGSMFTFAESLLYDYKALNYNITDNSGTFSQNPLYGLWGLYFSPLKGLFVYSPFLLVGLLGIKKLYNKNSSAVVLMISYIIVISLLYSLWVDCFGASPLGARYLISIIPFFIVLSAYQLNHSSVIVIYLYTILSIYTFLILFINVLDGLPSRLFLKCFVYNYAIFNKAKVYITDILNNKVSFAPVILNYYKNFR